MMREISLSATAILLAVLLPLFILVLIWRHHFTEFSRLFSLANESGRFYEVMACIIPLTILEGTLGLFFLTEFERPRSLLARTFWPLFVLPLGLLNIVSYLLVGAALNYKDEVIPSPEYGFVASLVVVSVVLMFTADGFMAAARAEVKHRRQPHQRVRKPPQPPTPSAPTLSPPPAVP
jgi:hypothetical protein